MIQELFIKNIALIDEIRVSFRRGFNVLSGETGAGKSIIVDSVNLILGSRSDKDLIKAGEKSAYVEALIALNEQASLPAILAEYGIVEKEVVLSRELSENGRSVCRVNGRLVNLAALRTVASALVSIYGQNQNQWLLDENYHLLLIDEFAGEKITAYKEKVKADFARYFQAKRELESLQKTAADKNRMLDLLQYQIAEIRRASLNPGEEVALLAEKTKLLNAEKIAQGINGAKDALNADNGALSSLYGAMRAMESIANLDARYEKIRSELSDAYYLAEDASYELSDCAGEVIYEETRLMEIEDRLAVISSLKRKYGASIEEILEFLSTAMVQYEELQNSEVRLDTLHRSVEDLQQTLNQSSEALTEKRKHYARLFEERLVAELADLGMGGAVLRTEFIAQPLGANGCDEVQFLLSVNKGVPPRKLSAVASGGEMSRIMLAIKNIVAQKEEVATMIFDEIDAGISGNMAHTIAKKMANIARERQVICVTHLSQIAAMGDANFYIEKKEESGRAVTMLSEISGKELVREISRLSGGLDTKAALEHGRELLQNAAKTKQKIL